MKATVDADATNVAGEPQKRLAGHLFTVAVPEMRWVRFANVGSEVERLPAGTAAVEPRMGKALG